MRDRTSNRHVVHLNLGLLRAIGLDAGAIEFPIDDSPSEIAQSVRQAAEGRYAVLNPGAAWPNKRWPSARLATVAAALAERHGLRSVVIWGPGERDLAQEVVAAASGAAVLSPPTSIADLVALARGAAIMVSGDTGPTHIAAAVGTPLVGIYGPTRPERNGPWRAADVTVSRADVCECHHLRRCRRETMCLMDITAAEVLDAVERRLAAEPTRV
jgi:ADP-heptose:LPS heptosyltransferase